MYRNTIVIRCLFFWLIVFGAAVNAQSKKSTADSSRVLSKTGNDNLKVWVFFTTKNDGSAPVTLSKKSVLRRSSAHFTADTDDAPVNSSYIDEIVKLGGVLENVYKWGNAASFKIPESALSVVSQLRYVKSIRPVGVFGTKKLPEGVLEKRAQIKRNVFQQRQIQLDMLNVPQAHYYLNKKGIGSKPGEGVLVGFFDSGFRLDHTCFSLLKLSGKIKAQYDFVDGDSDPQDSDSSLNHGSTVLAQVAGYDPGNFMGSAWGVDVALARTEISEKEIHTEEDNWVAALVWAESLGVDIVSSSVGYATDFEDSVLIDNEYLTDYPYSSLDGHSTIISHAAALAVKRGMLIVNAIGNEGNTPGSLNAPADVDGVVAVGAVTSRGYLTNFSSIGPTWDGRIKPDCVAPGDGIVIPVFNPSGSYMATATGTSYSTPLVSGILAMIIQASKEKSAAAAVIQKLLKNCHFLPAQGTIDNWYGHGIPDALLSVMDSNDVFIHVTDSIGIPVAGAEVHTITEHLAGVTDSSGILLLNDIAINTSLYIGSSIDSSHFTVDQLPFYKHIIRKTVSSLDIKIVNEQGLPVRDCGIAVTVVKNNAKWNFKSGENGVVRFVYGQNGDVDIAVSAPGYFTPAAVRTTLIGIEDSVIFTLVKIPENSLVLFPTLLKKSDDFVTLLFSGALKSNGDDVIASIYSVSGKLVWTERKKARTNEPVVFKWRYRSDDCLTPGTYYATIRYNKKLYKKKMLIAG